MLEEIPKGDASFCIKRKMSKYLTYPYHYHPEYELTLIIKGAGNRFTGNSVAPFSDNDFVLMGKNLPHFWKNAPEYYENNELTTECIVLHFDKDCMGSAFFELNEMREINNLLEKSGFGIRFSNPVMEKAGELLKKLIDKQKAKRISLFIEILDLCAQDTGYQLLSSSPLIAHENELDLQRISKIYDYVVNEMHADINIADIAKRLGLTVTSFCRYFKSRTGLTFSAFVNKMRIEYACSLLLTGKYSFHYICYASGFNSLSYFNRQFKKLKGITPTDFRRKYSNPVALNSFKSMKNL